MKTTRLLKLAKQDYIFVGLQFLLFAAFCFEGFFDLIAVPALPKNTALFLAGFGCIFIVITLLQLGGRISPFPSPKSKAVLVQNGMFKVVRHPIYTGVMLFCFGCAIYLGSLYKVVITVLLFMLFCKKSAYEEQKLEEKFADYKLYKKRTGRFFPKFSFLFEN